MSGQIFGRGQITTCRRQLGTPSSTGEDPYSTLVTTLVMEQVKGDLGVGELQDEAGVLLLLVVERPPLRTQTQLTGIISFIHRATGEAQGE